MAARVHPAPMFRGGKCGEEIPARYRYWRNKPSLAAREGRDALPYRCLRKNSIAACANSAGASLWILWPMPGKR
jgi:hypothetical protein